MSFTKTDIVGQGIIAWDKVNNAKVYVVYQSTDPALSESTWVQTDICAKAKLVVTTIDVCS